MVRGGKIAGTSPFHFIESWVPSCLNAHWFTGLSNADINGKSSIFFFQKNPASEALFYEGSESFYGTVGCAVLMRQNDGYLRVSYSGHVDNDHFAVVHMVTWPFL